MYKKLDIFLVLTFLLLSAYFIRSHTAPGSTDSYWHLTLGRQIWQQKTIPKYDNFVYGSEKNQFYLNSSTEWLSSLIMYMPVHFFGLKAVYLERLFFGLAILILILLTLRIVTSNRLIIAFSLVFLGYVLPSRLSLDRVENFSLLFLALINYVCFHKYFKGQVSKLAYALPFVFLIWPNMHPFIVVGYIILLFWATFLFIGFIRKKITNPDSKTFLIIAAISLLVATIQFNKTFYFSQANLVDTFNVGEMDSIPQRFARIKLNFISQVPFELYAYLFVLALLITIQALHFKKEFKNYESHAIFAMYFLLFLISFRYFRYIDASLIIIWPYLSYQLSKISKEFIPLRYFLICTYLLILVLILASIAVGHVLGWRQYWRYNQDAKGSYISIRNFGWTPQFPPGLPLFISKNLDTRHLFTSKLWDNYFLWYLPGVKTFSDSLWDYRSQQSLIDEQSLSAGSGNWEGLLKKYNVDTVVNSQYDSIFDNFTPAYILQNWKLAYVDGNAVIYAREDIVKSLPVDLSQIQPQKAYIPFNLSFDPKNEKAVGQIKNLLIYDNKNAFARTQLILLDLNYKNDLDDAQKLTLESKKTIPNDPIFSFFMAAIYARQNKCDLALDFAKEMKQKSFGDYNFIQAANSELSKCATSI